MPRFFSLPQAGFIALLLVTRTFNASAQCPSQNQVSSNDKCFVMSWENVPSPLPGSISSSSQTFYYYSGSGSSTDPAVYKISGEPSSACNASQQLFTGSITIDGTTCSYNNSVILPLRLEVFSVTLKRSGKAIVRWITASEQDIRSFELHKSSDGIRFDLLTGIPARGQTDSRSQYGYDDDDPAPGNGPVYYRLTAIGTGSQQEVLRTVRVEGQTSRNGQTLSLRNRDGRWYLSLPAGTGTMADLYDLSGRRRALPLGDAAGEGAPTLVPLPEDLLPGLYTVRLRGADSPPVKILLY